MGVVLDSTFLVDLLRGRETALGEAQRLEAEEVQPVLPAPVLYEILSGIRFRGSGTEAARFRNLASGYRVRAFDREAADAAADVRAELLRLGEPKGTVDTMVAGIARAEGEAMLTRDEDFQVIAEAVELEVRGY